MIILFSNNYSYNPKVVDVENILKNVPVPKKEKIRKFIFFKSNSSKKK
jgi:hypothetical protein